MQQGTVTNTVDSILRIIDIKEGSTTMCKELKTMKPYIIGLATIEHLQICNKNLKTLPKLFNF